MSKLLFLLLVLLGGCGKKADIIQSPQPDIAQELADLRAEMLSRLQDIEVDMREGKQINQADLEDAYTFYKSMCASIYGTVVDPTLRATEINDCVDKNMKPYVDNFIGESNDN
jgi:hypothetical protein